MVRHSRTFIGYVPDFSSISLPVHQLQSIYWSITQLLMEIKQPLFPLYLIYYNSVTAKGVAGLLWEQK